MAWSRATRHLAVTCGSRLRPRISKSVLRPRNLQRAESTVAVPLQSVASPPPPQPPSPPIKKSFSWGTAVFTASFLFIGSTVGFFVASIISPPPYPTPGSSEDNRLLALLAQDIDRLPIVIKLRDEIRKSTGKGSEIMGVMAMERRLSEKMKDQNEGESDDAAAAWSELPTIPPRPGSLKEQMSGMGGMGVQRAFWNAKRKELITITWIGGALCGWPGLAHGGAMAAMLAENSGRAVQWSGRGKIDAEEDPASIALTYLKPTNISAFYILRSQIEDGGEGHKLPLESSLSASKDMTKRQAAEDAQSLREGQHPVIVHAALETIDGKVCVKATTTWNT